MLAITPQMKILVATEPADFRNYAEPAVMPSAAIFGLRDVREQVYFSGKLMTEDSA